jgi:hypothetical protein
MFKVGDKVKLCVEKNYINVSNDVVYTISKVGEFRLSFEEVKDEKLSYPKEEFELVKDVKFKVGDRVMYNKEGGWSTFKGDLGIILRVDEDETAQVNWGDKKKSYACLSNLDLIEECEFEGLSIKPCKVDLRGISAEVGSYVSQDTCDVLRYSIGQIKENKGCQGTTEREKNYMKLLEMYKQREMEIITEVHKQEVTGAEEKDVNMVKIKLMEREITEINRVLGDDNFFSQVATINYSKNALLSKETREALKGFEEAASIKVKALDEFIKEVEARLELCDPSEESKVDVLKEYGILDKKGRLVK